MNIREEWAQLVSTTDHISEPVTIKKNKFILGRARTSDLVFEGNKLVSGCHCTIEKDGDGKVWLQDTSTNGTLVNLTKKVHKMKIEIQHGDEIHLVYRKTDPCSNIAYLFQDMATLAAEEVDTTLEYSSEQDVDSQKEEHVPISVLVRRRTFEGATSDDEPEPKRARTDSTPPQTGSFGRQESGEPNNMDVEMRADDATQPPPVFSGGDATQPPPSEDETQAPPGISGGDATQPPPSEDETQAPPGISGGDATQPPPSEDETQAPPGISGGDATQPPPSEDETQAPPGISDETQAPPGISGGDATQPPPSEDETQAPPGISGGDATQPPPSEDETQAPPGISGGDATQPPPSEDETQAPPGISGGDATQPPPSEDETQAPPGISGGDATQPPPSEDETQAPPGISGGDATQPPPSEDETQAPPGISDETQAPPGISGGDATQPPPSEDETQAPPTTTDIEETLPPPVAIETQIVNPQKSRRKAVIASDATQVINTAAMETQAATQVVTSDISNQPGTSAATQLVPTTEAADPDEVKGPRTRRTKLRRITSLKSEDKIKTVKDTTPSEEKVASEETKPKEKEEATKEKAEETMDPYEETLICIICQEIMHNVISLQPCMHSFCAGCYSGWMKRSNECPSCRGKVQRINKNHLVNNLVAVYLSQHPEKKRSEEDIAELEAKTTIKTDMSFPKDRGSFDPDSQDGSGPFDDDEDDDDDEESDYDSTDEDENDGGIVLQPYKNKVVGAFGTPIYPGNLRPQPTVCRQCPGYTGAQNTFGAAFAAVGNMVHNVVNLFTGTPNPAAPTVTAAAPTPGTAAPAATIAAATADGAQPGTSDGTTRKSLPDTKVMATAPAYVCRPGQTHILCACCLQPMPDRRADFTLRPDTERPQQCRLCYRIFCHAYWGCNQANCLGCLGKFSDLNFGKQCLPALIMENHFESQILEQYLTTKSMSVKDLLAECCAKLDTGEYKCPTMIILTSDTQVCYTCGLRQFRELAYQYRKDIPDDQLPDAAKGRPDCYWGKNCRTQKGKLQHSIRFNHVCEQTRKS